MADDQTNRRTCDLRVMLSGYGVKTEYDAANGYKREMTLPGHVDDSIADIYQDERFHGKPVHISLSTPPDQSWLDGIKTAAAVDNTCGGVIVNANVEAELFESDGETLKVEPIRVAVAMTSESFEGMRCLASEAYDRGRIACAIVTLDGKSLPEISSRIGLLHLKDLDVSVQREYAVRRITLFETRQIAHRGEHVVPIDRGQDQA